jgi:tetratricopeptide (TPR) repeat protein
MSIFNRLFGSKKNNVEPENNQQKQSGKPITDSKSEMPQSGVPWRTFPIFISSTFADMQAERDHLKHVVFPLVEEELQKRRIKLEIVDLRWGVDTTSMAQEDEREASVLKVCLDEIRRCRPFFIGLLGDRYGWVPPLERMKTALVGETHINPEKGKSVTDLEIEFGVLASREQLVRSVFYFREPLPYETFSKKKAAMFSDEHNDELSEAEKKERKTALEKLKSNIRKHFTKKELENKVKTYSGIWNAEKEKITGLESWGNIVKNDILAECESHAKDTWDKVPQNWQEQELALLDAFIENNTTTFCGRKPLLETLKKHLFSSESANWGVVLTGESGSGKSAVFSMVNKMMQKENCFILAHSSGLSPRAKKVADLLKIWNNQLRKHLGIDQVMEDTSPIHPSPFGEEGVRSETPIEELQKLFTKLLQMASAKKRVVLLIDALDRFEPTARAQHLSWLPSLMPKNVRLLCTAITNTEKKAVQYHKGLTAKSFDSFTSVEAKEMLDALCLRQHKNLPAKIEKIILEKKRADGQPATSSPLWLSLAVNMLMAVDHDDFEKMSQLEGRGDQQIESYLVAMANDFDPLPGPLFLSLKNKAGVLFGETFTTAIFNFIAISRNGLREKDLEKLLPTTNIAWDPLQFANLRRWFKTHLVLQGEELQWNLAHSILHNILLDNLQEEGRKAKHQTVGSYLRNLPDNDSLKISETMYHLMQANNKEMAAFYYGSYWWDAPQTDGSSKAMAEAVIIDETLGKSDWMDWLVSLPQYGDREKLNPRTISNNFIFSLFDKYFQTDINIQTRIRLVQSAEERMEELCHRVPDSVGYSYDICVTYIKLGNLYQQHGNFGEAATYYESSTTIAEELRSRSSHATVSDRVMSLTHSRLCDLYLILGSKTKALDSYFEYLRLYLLWVCTFKVPSKLDLKSLNNILYEVGLDYMTERIKSDDPMLILRWLSVVDLMEIAVRQSENIDGTITELLEEYLSLTDFHFNKGITAGVLEFYDRSIIPSDRESGDTSFELSICQLLLGDLHHGLGNKAKSLRFYEKSLALREELLARNPQSSDYARALSVNYNKLGDLYLKLGDPTKALDKYQASLNIREELRRRAPDSAEYARDLYVSYYKIMNFSQNQDNQLEFLKYARLCKEALLYMKNSKMFMDEPLINVLNSLEKY